MFDMKRIVEAAKELNLEIVEAKGIAGFYTEQGELIMSFDEIIEKNKELWKID